MWTLRLILILLGIAFIAGVYFYTRRHPPRKRGSDPSRAEPSLTLERSGAVRAPGGPRREPSVTVPGAGPGSVPESGIEAPDRLRETENRAGPTDGREEKDEGAEESIFQLALRLPREGVEASRLLPHLERLGLTLDDTHIYRRVESDGQAAFNVANLYEPGTLAPLPPDSRLQGLNFFFMGVPSPAVGKRFERMLGMAYECARAFGGRLEDAQHHPLTAARELEMKLRAAGARQ